MPPPAPFPPQTPGTGPATPARAADTLARELARHGITGTYTAAAEKFAVISVTAELTAWTNGQLIWCTRRGQRRTWPAASAGTAVGELAALTP